MEIGLMQFFPKQYVLDEFLTRDFATKSGKIRMLSCSR